MNDDQHRWLSWLAEAESDLEKAKNLISSVALQLGATASSSAPTPVMPLDEPFPHLMEDGVTPCYGSWKVGALDVAYCRACGIEKDVAKPADESGHDAEEVMPDDSVPRSRDGSSSKHVATGGPEDAPTRKDGGAIPGSASSPGIGFSPSSGPSVDVPDGAEPSPTLTLQVAEDREFKVALDIYFDHVCNKRPLVSNPEFGIWQETAKQLVYEVARHALKAARLAPGGTADAYYAALRARRAESEALHGFLRYIAKSVGLDPENLESYDDVCNAVDRLCGSAGADPSEVIAAARLTVDLENGEHMLSSLHRLKHALLAYDSNGADE